MQGMTEGGLLGAPTVPLPNTPSPFSPAVRTVVSVLMGP
ncbi:hypothetical protein D2E23_2000 [Bifidobacterium callimiconis]|uniref:Uncharacterized protein n=1 Tax=Bifidobacterium callimiconis TaxID=2306973 RepID=A0A430F9L2_9BIFI|nr:hypothetical protein D2E23_2000 [Bifidobacterium callimiconis]